MTHSFSRIFMALGLALSLAMTTPAEAQVNPTEQSVSEDALFEALGTDGPVTGRISIPDANASYLIKPENRSWAALRSDTLPRLSLWSLVGMIALLTVFYLVRGKIRPESGMSGRKILRFKAVERFAHWTLATTFIILALTGLNVLVGKSVILPLVGEAAFGTLTGWGKLAHNFLAWPFMIALVAVLVLWVAQNIPNRTDARWVAQGGGFLKKGVHPPAGKFNFGQKLIFWSVILGGAALSFTGIMLLFPAGAGTPTDWQFYQTIHALTATVLTAIIVAHIYIGSVGMEGAFDAMSSGEVDENWAKEHHSLWVEEVNRAAAAKGARPAAPVGSAHPAE